MFNKQRSEVGGQKSEIDCVFIPISEVGQTLIEALLSVAVAIIVVVALVGVGITSMRTANFGKNQAEAVRLARQNLEILRSQRDASWLAFASGLQTNNCGSPNYCCLNSSKTIITYNSSLCLVNTLYDTSFNYDSATFDPSGLITLTSHVRFNEGSITRDVTLTETFTNWQSQHE